MNIRGVVGYLNQDMDEHLSAHGNWRLDPGKLEAAIEANEDPRAVYKCVFVIERDGGHIDGIYIVSAANEELAYHKMHAYLYGKYPDRWSSQWTDLKEDVETGNQLMFQVEAHEVIELD